VSRLATIDIGTNTTLLLVADANRGDVTVLDERAEITRLGRGIGSDGGLGRAGIDRTLAVLRDYTSIAARHGALVHAIGTEGLRRASNAADFLGPAAQILGCPVEVIDGEREAALTFLAAQRSFPDASQGRTIVVDIGGGSTEIILADGTTLGFRCSLPLGSVRLTERHVRHDPPLADELAAVRADVDAALTAVPFSTAQATLIGTAGTVTTLCAMHLGLRTYDPAQVHGYRLPSAALAEQIARLAGSTQPEREAMAGLDPRRADVILCGAIILLAIADRARTNAILVSDRGIRWGLLYERLGEPGVAGPRITR
jgi:exopolyphosphatase/guanosine-5'-triphosphate,3'-diphosphate pyrophosphatase